MTKRRKRSLCEASIVITAMACIMAICLLPAKIAGATESHLNETVIQLIETIEPSVEVDIMLYSEREEAGVYHRNTPEAETALETQNMTVTDDTAVEVVQTEWVYPLTESDIRLVALIAELEDRGAMPEIAEVILNRVLSDRFEGDTVSEIIYAKGQFHSVSRITDNMHPSDEAIQATLAVFRDGASTVGDSLFFAEKSIDKGKIAKGLYLVETMSETAFYAQK